jgi:poly-gamma-glutamate synthesis protein (capsule biosynthesis protein)
MGNSTRLKIGLLGDICIVKDAYEVMQEQGTEVFAKSVFESVDDCDLIIANLEAPVTNCQTSREKKQYNLQHTADVLDIFDSRFAITIANNHMMDFGEEGLLDTISALKNKNIDFAGAGKDIESAGKVIIKQINDYKVGVICAADPRSNPATENTAGTYPADAQVVTSTIKSLNEEVDLIIVTVHAGIEFVSIPSPFQQSFAKQCHEAGASIVQYHHTHCVSGISKTDGCITFLGSGNFIFPYVLPKGFKPWFKTASWIVEYDFETKKLEYEIRPLEINKSGIPELMNEKESNIFLRRIKKISQQVHLNKNLSQLRLLDMLKPIYLKFAVIHYCQIAKERGLKAMFLMIVNGFKSQFTK